MKLREWFQYQDRHTLPYNPTIGTTITIEKFWRNSTSALDAPDSRKEECLIRSALVPVDQLNAAASKITLTQALSFEMGWNSSDKFSFGNYAQYGDIQLSPLSLLIKHPVTENYTIELGREFTIYHALQKRNDTQYYHPIDNLLVAETHLESHDIHNHTANVIIHRDYLRDFLSAVNMGLLICVTADRFANAPSEEELELEQIQDNYIDEFTYVSTHISKPEFTHNNHFMGRSILRRNFVIKPYDKPKFQRSPWHYSGTIPEEELPAFIVNSEGKRQTLPRNTYLGNYISNGIGNHGYLYFRPNVLQKYLQGAGYSVFFHMRNWGEASLPGNRGTIDVGINSQGLVNAFAPDITDLNFSEQAYWASFSSLPSGEICEEMFETRMQQNRPHSPGVTKLVEDARSQVSVVFQNQFSVDIFNDIKLSEQERCRLSIGAITHEYDEILNLAKILYTWVIETMQIESLRSALTTLGGKVDKQLRQIKLLEQILIIKCTDENQARKITAPLVALNQLRIGSAHIGNTKLEPVFELIGVSKIPPTPRIAWNLCVDAVVSSLNSIKTTLET